MRIMAENMYFDYRTRASRDNLSLRSRASAAELLGISESSLSNYETGKTKCVPPEMVAQMSKLYNAPELRNIYCTAVCPIGCNNLAVNESSVEQVAVHLLKSLDTRVISDQLDILLTIAQDGIIDETEVIDLTEISKVFDRITYVISEFRVLAERNGVEWN